MEIWSDGTQLVPRDRIPRQRKFLPELGLAQSQALPKIPNGPPDERIAIASLLWRAGFVCYLFHMLLHVDDSTPSRCSTSSSILRGAP